MWLSDVPMHHWAFGGRPRWDDNYWVHSRVMRLFGELDENSPRKAAGVLYRAEPGLGSGRVLVQSVIPTTDCDVRTIDLTAALSILHAGQRVGIRVKANAAKTVNRSANGVSRTHREVRPPEDLEEWLRSAVQPSLNHLQLDAIEIGLERQRKVPISTATLDATAVVADPDALIALVTEGIGKARAFGCGLISVRPIRSAS